MTGEHHLPPFPVDDTTLDLLELAVDPWKTNPAAEKSSLWDFLDLMSQMGGSDTEAVSEEHEGIRFMRDEHYCTHNVIEALVAEVRRLRAA